MKERNHGYLYENMCGTKADQSLRILRRWYVPIKLTKPTWIQSGGLYSSRKKMVHCMVIPVIFVGTPVLTQKPLWVLAMSGGVGLKGPVASMKRLPIIS